MHIYIINIHYYKYYIYYITKLVHVRRIIPEVDQSTKRRFSLASEILCA